MTIRDDNDARLKALQVGYGGRVAPALTVQKGLQGRLGEPIFCASCTCFCGYVTAELPAGIFFLCDGDNGCGHNCETRFGVMPEMHRVADPDGYRGV